MSPFLPVNKILLNEDNDDNPKTTDTSLSGKYDMSHTSRDNFTEKTNDKKITNNDEGTDELAFMKQKVNTIRGKGLNRFEGQSTGSKGWFKHDIEFLKQLFLKVI